MESYRIRLAQLSEVGRLQEIERAAAALFREYGLDELFSSVVTPLSELEQGARLGRL